MKDTELWIFWRVMILWIFEKNYLTLHSIYIDSKWPPWNGMFNIHRRKTSDNAHCQHTCGKFNSWVRSARNFINVSIIFLPRECLMIVFFTFKNIYISSKENDKYKVYFD